MNVTGNEVNNHVDTNGGAIDARDGVDRRSPLPLTIVKTDQAITEEELKEFKEMVRNYRVAKYGVIGLIGLGSFIFAVVKGAVWLWSLKP